MRLDAIGDYVLFRNYLYSLKEHPDFKYKKFILLGNTAFKTLAESYDTTVIDRFIWIKPSVVLGNNTKLKLKLIFKLKFYMFDTVINPVHSRLMPIDEFISKVGAKYKIASKGDDSNFATSEDYINSSKYYDELIDVPWVKEFEFYRNRVFFQNLLGTSGKELSLCLPHQVTKETKSINIVVVPGAGEDFRRWSPLNFASVINQLHGILKVPINCDITGSAGEEYLAEQVYINLTKDIIASNLAGKISLTQLVTKIGAASLLISNDTSAIHIAAATGTPAVCISNGNHFGRFNPYPDEFVKNIKTVYPNQDFYEAEKRDELVHLCRYKSELDINKVKVSTVVDIAVSLLNFN